MCAKVAITELCEKLELKVLQVTAEDIEFSSDEINRPGLQFTGYYEHFLAKRVQLIGNAEMHYLCSLTQAELMQSMRRFMSFEIPCIVCARGQIPPQILLDCAREYGIAVLLSERKTGEINHAISKFLERKLAPKILMHGVLLDVFGVGILLTGESSIGKSETALELVKTGQRLVADDVVEITRLTDRLSGCAPQLTRHLMEVRGIGIVDVRYLYGVGAVMPQKDIDMVMQMELWNENTEYERLSMGEQSTDILGIKIPCTKLPVSPGRNLAVVIEVAARNLRLKRMGYDVAKEFEHKVLSEMLDMNE
ncbi:MAG: HPr(Ser) kinase/phosphatase [Clostridia bacterium]